MQSQLKQAPTHATSGRRAAYAPVEKPAPVVGARILTSMVSVGSQADMRASGQRFVPFFYATRARCKKRGRTTAEG